MRRIPAAFALLFLLTLLVRLLPEPSAPALSADERSLPVVMYHSLLKDPRRAGTYIVSPETFRSDLVYLEAHGYQTVLPSELVAFSEGRAELPAKPVLITFDDGCLNNLTYALPILEALDAKAVVSAVGAFTDAYTNAPDPNPNYAYLSWTDLKALYDSGRVEIGNHTDRMHGADGRPGCMKLAGETSEAYASALRLDVGRMQAALLTHGIPSCTFAYPFGRISPEAAPILKDLGFSVTLTCYERINRIEKGDPGCLTGLGRFNRPAGESPADFFSRILSGA